MKRIVGLLACILLCEAVGVLGSIFTFSAIPTWYAGLTRPSFAPPNWVFGPVWTTLYLFMGIVLFRLLWVVPRTEERDCALKWFFIQLGFNAFWTPLFFGLHALWTSFVWIALLLGTLVVLERILRVLDRLSMWLMAPYIAWVSFATVLTFAYAWLN